MNYNRGDIVLVNFNPQKKSEEVSKVRPAIIVSNRELNDIFLKLNSIFENASKNANKNRHDYISTEHIFLELIKTDDIKQILNSLDKWLINITFSVYYNILTKCL